MTHTSYTAVFLLVISLAASLLLAACSWTDAYVPLKNDSPAPVQTAPPTNASPAPPVPAQTSQPATQNQDPVACMDARWRIMDDGKSNRLCKGPDTLSFTLENYGTADISLTVVSEGGEGTIAPVQLLLMPGDIKSSSLLTGVGDTKVIFTPYVLVTGNRVICKNKTIQKDIAQIELC